VIVSLAAAGLWIGAGVVVLILAWLWLRNCMTTKMLWRLNRFRDDFRQLLKITEHGGIGQTMLKEDKEFLLKVRDSILFPLVVAPERRESVRSYDLERIEILYREYCRTHIDGPYPAECSLCAGVRRVREYIEGVLSKFEGQIEAARTALIARIDGRDSEAEIHTKNFLDKYRDWENGRWPQDPDSASREKLLKTLRDRESWAFDEADQVRDRCRKEIEENRYSDSGNRALQMFDELTSEMEAAAKRCGVEEAWRFYNTNKNWLIEGSGSPFEIRMEYTLKNMRRAFGRQNPETTVRELCYSDGSVCGFDQLQPLKSYGFDLEVVKRELRAAWNLVAKERRKRTEEQRVFSAARSFFELDKAEYTRRVATAPPQY
jgi:hypothetical protein